MIEQKLGGTGQLYAILKDPDGIKGLSDGDRARFEAILTSLNKQLSNPIDPQPIVRMMQRFDMAETMTKDNVVLSRFVSKDGLSYLIPVPNWHHAGRRRDQCLC